MSRQNSRWIWWIVFGRWNAQLMNTIPRRRCNQNPRIRWVCLGVITNCYCVLSYFWRIAFFSRRIAVLRYCGNVIQSTSTHMVFPCCWLMYELATKRVSRQHFNGFGTLKFVVSCDRLLQPESASVFQSRNQRTGKFSRSDLTHLRTANTSSSVKVISH